MSLIYNRRNIDQSTAIYAKLSFFSLVREIKKVVERERINCDPVLLLLLISKLGKQAQRALESLNGYNAVFGER